MVQAMYFREAFTNIWVLLCIVDDNVDVQKVKITLQLELVVAFISASIILCFKLGLYAYRCLYGYEVLPSFL